jgi:uncharacterized protein (TIGR00369 family)
MSEHRRMLFSALTRLCERIPFQASLGFSLASVDPVVLRFPFAGRADLVGHPLHGRLHGGVICTALDSVGALAIMEAIAIKHESESIDQVLSARFARVGTIDLRTDFLRPGAGTHFVATAKVTRLGGRVGSAIMELKNQDGLLIATGAGSYIVS